MSTRSHAVPGTLAGFKWQVVQALVYLIRSRPGTRVQLESHDDVVLFRKNSGGQQVVLTAIQTKHSIAESTPQLSLKSVDLWKTLEVWCDDANSAAALTDAEQLILVTSDSVATNSIFAPWTGDTPPANKQVTALQRELDRIASVKTNSELSSAFDSWERCKKKTRAGIVQRFRIVPGVSSESADELLRDAVKQKFEIIPEPRVSYFITSIRGWFENLVDRSLRDPRHEITREMLVAEVQSVLEHSIVAALPHRYANEAVPHSAGSREATYIRQLAIVGVDEEGQEIAVRDCFRAQNERYAWRNSGVVPHVELDAFDQDLVDQWSRIRSRLLSQLAHRKEPQIGREIYVNCTGIDSTIGNSKPKSYVTCGTLHILSDDVRIGWHPDYRTIFRSATSVNSSREEPDQ